jgi:hypothetical protein
MRLDHIVGLVHLTYFGTVAAKAMISKFYDLPAWFRITVILMFFCTTYPTAREKTEWGRRIHFILQVASVGFFLFFVNVSLVVTGVLLGILALDCFLLFFSFRKYGW